MTGPAKLGPGSRPVRRNKLIKERVHDTYKTWGKLPEPTVCPDCGAVWHKGRWQWTAPAAKAHRQRCPACHRVHDRFPAGYVTLGGSFLALHRDEVLHLVRNHGDKARAEHPLERIIAVEERNGGAVVTTTGIHLARAIGDALASAYQGTLEFQYNDGENLLRVHWARDVEPARPKRR